MTPGASRIVLAAGMTVMATAAFVGVASIVILGFGGESVRDYVGCVAYLVVAVVTAVLGLHIAAFGAAKGRQ